MFRAKIINIIINEGFEVSYIDFGNTEIIQLSDIFELSNELKEKVSNKKVQQFFNYIF